MNRIVLAFGSNVGNRLENIRLAVKKISEKCTFIISSKVYVNPPVGFLEQDDFFNSVAVFDTDLSPIELLKYCNEIENNLGRIRLFKDSPRTIDIDIIFYDALELNDMTLTIPHPRWHERDFVTTPLLDIIDSLDSDKFERVKKMLEGKEKKFNTCFDL